MRAAGGTRAACNAVALAALLAGAALALADRAGDSLVLVDGRKVQSLTYANAPWSAGKGCIVGPVGLNGVYAAQDLGAGDFDVEARISLAQLDGKWSEFALGDGHFFFDGEKKQLMVEGGALGPRKALGDASKFLRMQKPFDFEAKRAGKLTSFWIDGAKIYEADLGSLAVGKVGFVPHDAPLSIFRWSIEGAFVAPPEKKVEPLAPLGELQPAIENAIQRGVDFLFATQQRDGSWSDNQNEYLSGETALCVYTLLHCGLKPDQPAIARALRFMEPIVPEQTYVQGLTAMAFDATADRKWSDKLKLLAQKLIAAQTIGLWSYRGGRDAAGDISNTQYAVLGLRAAAHAGVEVPAKVWADLADAVCGLQETPRAANALVIEKSTAPSTRMIAGFRYGVGSEVTGSRTVAGISMLAIAREALGWRGGGGGAPAQNVARAIQFGLNWLDVNFAVDKNPSGDATWLYYYLYGVERVGSLLELESIGDHEWYRAGAQYLVRAQSAEGAWKGGAGDQHDTCYALLFLRRATRTAPSTGVDSWARPKNTTVLDAPLRVAADGATPCNLWIGSISETIQAADSNRELGGLRVKAIEYRCGDRLLARVPGRPSEPWKSDKFPARVRFETAGTYPIVAHLTLISPDAALDAETPTIELDSAPLEVRVDGTVEPWMNTACDERRRNLLIGQAVTASASSVNGGDEPKLAFDGLESSRWMCKNDDPAPGLTLELAKPIRASTLVLYTHCTNAFLRGKHDRILRVGVRINRQKEETEIAADDDELHPLVLNFSAPTNVDRVELRILARAHGSAWPGFAGFAEVSLEK